MRYYINEKRPMISEIEAIGVVSIKSIKKITSYQVGGGGGVGYLTVQVMMVLASGGRRPFQIKELSYV